MTKELKNVMEDNMLENVSLVSRRKYKIQENISIYIPTIGEIRGECDEDEINYREMINIFMVTSTNYMVDLDKIGINFENISDWQMFGMLFESLNGKNLSLLFGINVIANFELYMCNEDKSVFYIYDKNTNIKITQDIYEKISNIICKMNNVTKEHRKFSNDFSRKHAIERQIKVSNRNKEKNNNTTSYLDNLITALVCTADFPYNYETVLNVTIYDFISSVKQIKKKYAVDNYHLGIYTGNIDLNKSKISPKDLDWFITS